MSLSLILIAIGLAAASGLPGLGLSRSSVWVQRLSAVFMTLAAILGLSGAAAGLFTQHNPIINFPGRRRGILSLASMLSVHFFCFRFF
jgi:hypothetical protein